MLNLLVNETFWLGLIIVVLLIAVVYLCIKFETARWITGTIATCILFASAVYSCCQLNIYYSAEGGIYGYINSLIRNNQVVEQKGLEFKLTNISLTPTVNENEYSAMFYIDDVLVVEDGVEYGIFINGMPCANNKFADDHLGANFTYNFYGEEDELLMSDKLTIRIALFKNSTYIYLRTSGGSDAVNYWHKYFEKNDVMVNIKPFTYKPNSQFQIVEGSDDNAVYARYYNADNEICYIQNCYKGETLSFPLYNENDRLKFSGWSIDGKQEIDNFVIKEDTNFYACYNTVLSNDDYLKYALQTMKDGVLILDCASVNTVTEGFYKNNTDIKEVKILLASNNNSINIENNAFYGCSNLSKINSFDYIRNIGECAFYGTGFESLALSSSNTLSQGAFDSCNNLKSVQFEVFENTTENLIFGITELPDLTFANCSNLTYVSFPVTLETIGNSVFSYCKSLSSLNILPGIKTIGRNLVYGCNSNIEIKVPYDSKEDLPSGFDANFNVLDYSNQKYANVKYMGSDTNGLNYGGLQTGYWNIGGSTPYNPSLCVGYMSFHEKPYFFKDNYVNSYSYTKYVGGFVGVQNYEVEVELKIIDNYTLQVVNISDTDFDFETMTFKYSYDENGKYLTNIETGEILTHSLFDTNFVIVV